MTSSSVTVPEVKRSTAKSSTAKGVPGEFNTLSALNPLRSLVGKLLLAIVVVCIAASLLMASLIGWQTRQAFERFMVNRYRTVMVPMLVNYYAEHGTWEGADELLWLSEREPEQGVRHLASVTLVDAAGNALYTVPPGGTEMRVNVLGRLPIVIENEITGNEGAGNETVGWLLIRLAAIPVDSPESEFLARMSRAIVMGILLATVMAALLGLLLARTISQPIRALTAATRAMTHGALGTQVDIRTGDELGELGRSFNQMSTDLARSLQLRRQMTADIAHDLRTPLSVILGYTEALNDGAFTGDQAIYAILHDEAQHLSRLIEDLRMLSLADAGELPLQRHLTPPRELLERAAAAHRVQAEQKGVHLMVTAPADLPRVEVDPERMQQVLSNLVSNALRYTPAGGEIALRGGVEDGQVTLHVQDSGSGIAPDDLPMIFERFYRGDKSRHNQSGESGLGLAIAKSLVEMHHGVIHVTSQVGQGTIFTIVLPAVGLF